MTPSARSRPARPRLVSYERLSPRAPASAISHHWPDCRRELRAGGLRLFDRLQRLPRYQFRPGRVHHAGRHDRRGARFGRRAARCRGSRCDRRDGVHRLRRRKARNPTGARLGRHDAHHHHHRGLDGAERRGGGDARQGRAHAAALLRGAADPDCRRRTLAPERLGGRGDARGRGGSCLVLRAHPDRQGHAGDRHQSARGRTRRRSMSGESSR